MRQQTLADYLPEYDAQSTAGHLTAPLGAHYTGTPRGVILTLQDLPQRTILPSNHVAKYLANHYQLPLVDAHTPCDERPQPLVIVVAGLLLGGGAASLHRTRIARLVREAQTVVWVSNDYILDIPRWVWAARQPKPLHVWATHSARHHIPGAVWQTVDWNCLPYTPPTALATGTEPGLVYYGAYRRDRVPYFARYFTQTPYPITVYSSAQAGKKFAALDGATITVRPPLYDLAPLGTHALTVYLQDRWSNAHVTTPFCRFYEAVRYGLAQVFDADTVPALQRAGYDVTPWVVTSAEDVAAHLPHAQAIATEQRAQWGALDVVQRLTQQIYRLRQEVTGACAS